MKLPVEYHFTWLFKHILELLRFAGVCDGIGVADSEVNTSGSKPNLGQSIAVQGPAALSECQEFASFPWPDSVLHSELQYSMASHMTKTILWPIHISLAFTHGCIQLGKT